MPVRNDLRNVAIVAHVDHGKTTLVDAMLWQSGAFGAHQHVDDRVMDSIDLEREKGITILAKNTAVRHKTADGEQMTINIIDTPGHADFGGEVERGLSMVDASCCWSTPARARCRRPGSCCARRWRAQMPVILVINKVDRPDARIDEVVDETYELFLDLRRRRRPDRYFPIVYACARDGRASLNQPEDGAMPDSEDLEPLFQTILSNVPGPGLHRGRAAAGARHQPRRLAVPRPARAVPGARGHDPQGPEGRLVPPRRHRSQRVKITELLMTEALERKPAESAGPGDIIAVAGIPEIMIGETLADPDEPAAAAADHRRRAGHLDDDRHQHLAAGRPGQGHQGHRPPGQGPARPGAGRQRVAAGAADRAPRHLGGAGPRRAGAGHPGRADAPRGLRADRRQAAGGHPRDRRQACTSRSSG